MSSMKIRNIILSVIAIISLCECTKEKSEDSYTNMHIVTDNERASLFFHTVFREAENAWATIHREDYKSGTYSDPASTSTGYKKLTYNEDTKTVTIDYNAWLSDNLLLVGTISVKFDINSYRIDKQTASTYLTAFSINAHNIVGESKIQYRKVESSDNDHYTYTLLDGAIHEEGSSKPILISGAVTNGQYERKEGSETFLQDDDVWAYSGAMTGTLRNDPNLKYTNTVLTTYATVSGEEENGTVHYAFSCTTALSGVSQIKASGRPDIIFGYYCSGIDFLSVTRVD